MLSLDDALARCLSVALPRRVEEVDLMAAHGRVLAKDVHARRPSPPWDNSAMDGFAVIAADTGTGAVDDGGCCDGPVAQCDTHTDLRVLETIAAGSWPQQTVVPGTCARIMTGAPMPAGADSVVMREQSEILDDGRVRLSGVARRGQHVRRQGEELKEGQRVVPAGRSLNAHRIGLCAALGHPRLTVAVRPRVAILGTGDELVPTGAPLAPGQIWSSNSAAIAALVIEAGGEPIDCGIAPDDLEGTHAAFQRALACQPDVLISSGGVSVGDFDVVKEALGGVGADMRFWKVAMKPGKPLAFGVIGGIPAFGLPGNPVSCAVNFLQFVRPLIQRALGKDTPFLPVVEARLAAPIRKRAGRVELARVTLRQTDNGWEASSTGAQGSGMPTSMALASGLAVLAAESTGAAAGDTVLVQLLDTSFLERAAPRWPWSTP